MHRNTPEQGIYVTHSDGSWRPCMCMHLCSCIYAHDALTVMAPGGSDQEVESLTALKGTGVNAEPAMDVQGAPELNPNMLPCKYHVNSATVFPSPCHLLYRIHPFIPYLHLCKMTANQGESLRSTPG